MAGTTGAVELSRVRRSRIRTVPLGRKLAPFLVIAPPFLYMLVLYTIPMLAMLFYSLGKTENYQFHLSWTFEQYQRFLVNPALRTLLVKSFKMATIVTVACLIMGYPVSYLLARMVSKRWQYPLLLLLIIPAWTSFVIRTYSWILVLGQSGLLNYVLQNWHIVSKPLDLVFNEFSVDVALIYTNLAWVILPIYVSLEKIDPSLLEAAESLGASAIQRFLRITFPLSLPGVVAGILMAFVPAISTYAIPVILGGTKGYMYGNLVQRQFLYLNWPFGAALSTIMLVLTFVILAVGSRFARLEELWLRP
jgi:spermidine/putrescine transport system permease protein